MMNNQYKYDGWLVHESYDEEGLIEVIDREGIRALHFGSEARQSTMSLAEPDKLLSYYLRAMMSWQLFKDECEKPLLIGLGGGLLAKYLFNTFPDCQIKVIEYRREVLKIARRYFGLPLDARLKVNIGDGVAYASQQSLQTSAQHDLILVDAFDGEGMAAGTISPAFFDSCKTLLTEDGLLVMNLWGNNKPLFAQIQSNLQQVFGERVLFLPVRGRGNVVALAFNEAVPKPTFKALKAKSWQLEERNPLEFPIFIKDLKRHNPQNFQRVVQL
jgi:spermidine synthase